MLDQIPAQENTSAARAQAGMAFEPTQWALGVCDSDAVSPTEGDGSVGRRSGRLFEDGQRRLGSMSSSGSLHSQPSGDSLGPQQL